MTRRRSRPLACLIATSCLLSGVSPAAAQGLNPVEKAMARYLDEAEEEKDLP